METSLNPRYTFESFVVGESNRMAYTTARSVVERPGTQYNPYVICGGKGLGKTHLMQAVSNEMKRLHPEAKVLYVTSEQFGNEYIDAAQHHKLKEFRIKYRSLDCLLIDDIHLMIARERLEQELFYTFASLFERNKQVVVSSERPSKKIPPLDQQMISRLEGGLVVAIGPPDLETRIAILRKNATRGDSQLADDVLRLIAAEVTTNVRSLMAALACLTAHRAMSGKPLTVDGARDVLKDATMEATSL